jgi:hypothetical protein
VKRCERCETNDGMVPDAPVGEIVWCDHGALERAVAAAEARDRVLAARARKAAS